jgi:hypothetical protein
VEALIVVPDSESRGYRPNGEAVPVLLGDVVPFRRDDSHGREEASEFAWSDSKHRSHLREWAVIAKLDPRGVPSIEVNDLALVLHVLVSLLKEGRGGQLSVVGVGSVRL